MMTPVTNIDDPESRPVPRFALFELGFRAFFLFAGITALLLVPLWVYAYVRGHLEFGYYSALTWHSHEMIFGYAAAVIAGFLLTAVRNWTNIQTPRGVALASLVALWLAGRVVPFFSGVMPHWSIAVVDMAFLPVLAVTLSVPLLRSRQKHNLVFLFVLAALTVANIMVHLQILGITEATAKHGIYFAVYLIVLLIAILGGRVIPFFTEKGIVGARIRRWATRRVCFIGQPGCIDSAGSGGRSAASSYRLCNTHRAWTRDTAVWLVPADGLVSPVTLGVAPGLRLAGGGFHTEGVVCGRTDQSHAGYPCIHSRWHWHNNARHDGASSARPHGARITRRTGHDLVLCACQPCGCFTGIFIVTIPWQIQRMDCIGRRLVECGVRDIRDYLFRYPDSASPRRAAGLRFHRFVILELKPLA